MHSYLLLGGGRPQTFGRSLTIKKSFWFFSKPTQYTSKDNVKVVFFKIEADIAFLRKILHLCDRHEMK